MSGSDPESHRVVEESATEVTSAMGGDTADSIAPGYADKVSLDHAFEAELIQRAKSDPEAFGKLYEAHYTAILNYIYRRTLDVNVAEELVSNIFFKALRALPKYRRRAPFRAWLYRIATNEIRMHWRRKQKGVAKVYFTPWEEQLERITFTSDETVTGEELEEKMRTFSRLHEALRALPERYQTALVLRYFEGLPYEEIAAVLGKRTGTIKSLVHHGLKRLRHLLEKQHTTFP